MSNAKRIELGDLVKVYFSAANYDFIVGIVDYAPLSADDVWIIIQRDKLHFEKTHYVKQYQSLELIKKADDIEGDSLTVDYSSR